MKSTKYVCDRCNVTENSRTGQWCPCPRGSCEAREILVKKKMFSRKDVIKLLVLAGNGDSSINWDEWVDHVEFQDEPI